MCVYVFNYLVFLLTFNTGRQCLSVSLHLKSVFSQQKCFKCVYVFIQGGDAEVCFSLKSVAVASSCVLTLCVHFTTLKV